MLLSNIRDDIAGRFRDGRPLSKLAYSEEVKEGSERKTGVYTLVREDLSTEPTHKLPDNNHSCRIRKK